MKIPKLILSRPKLVVDIKCPKCQSIDIVALLDINVKCKNCMTSFTTNAGINIYYSIAKKLIQLISHNNEVWILGERDASDVFNSDDILKPRSQHEDDVYHTMLAIMHNFEDQRCWEVTKITNEYDQEYIVRCNVCGICHNCVTCSSCGEKYTPKEVDTHQGKQKRYKCPKCSSRNYKKTFINKMDKICPYCNSGNIKKTYFPSHKKQCPKCHSDDITKPRNVPVYKLVIKRQPRFWIREV